MYTKYVYIYTHILPLMYINIYAYIYYQRPFAPQCGSSCAHPWSHDIKR